MCKKLKIGQSDCLYYSSHGREEAGALLSGCVAEGQLYTLGYVSASPMVEMETGGITAEAGGSEGSPSP